MVAAVKTRVPPDQLVEAIRALCKIEYRGVQYVHWVMHKCITVKVGEKRNTRKVCKKQVNLSKTGGNLSK